MNYDSLPSDCLSALSGLLRCQGDARTRVHIVPGREEDVVQHVDDVRNQGTDERSDPKARISKKATMILLPTACTKV